MRPNLVPDLELANLLFDTLRAQTFDGVGITREAYGCGERIAHEILRDAAQRLALEIAVDPAGNMLMTLPGADRAGKRVVIGSHLDSVPQGGNFDGAAGVIAGMAAVAGMKQAGFVPNRDITVLAIRAEEAGAWFPSSYPGSFSALGLLPATVLDVKRLDSGRTLADHMAEEGFDPVSVRAGSSLLKPADIAAYVELHIEQGPVLDAQQIPVGIVTGIPGSRRLRAGMVHGEYNHSGGTPRRFRRDAAIALSELAVKLDDHWAALDATGHRLVVTFCVLATTAEAGFTKVPGEAIFQLDIRSVEMPSVDLIMAELHRLVPEIEARRGVRFELGLETSSVPSPMDPAVRAGLAAAASALGITHIDMQSGGGHDAAAFAQSGVPSGMVFVRNQNGSHNPHEAMRMEDFAMGAAIVQRFAQEFAA